MANLAELDELCRWMRSVGATSACVGTVSLTLGPPPQALPMGEELAPLAASSIVRSEREELETLLYSSGVSADAFLPPRKADS